MKKQLLILFALFLTAEIFGQTSSKYWIQFTDKGNNPYTLSNPSAYLSPRALARRTAMGIAIDSTDLPVTPAYVAGVAATGVTVHATSKWLNGVVIFTTDTNALNLIAALPYVAGYSGVGLRTADETSNKFDAETFGPVRQARIRSGNVISSTLNYGSSFNQIDMLGGVCLHNAGFTGEGVHIAVIDAGFYNADSLPCFDSLFMNNRILGTWDFVAGDSSVYEDNTHGTMVLSCMGGNLPGQLVGTAPDASYWLLRSEEAATEYLVEEYYWASAAEFADSAGADAINSSLGYTTFDDPAQNHTYADMNGYTTPCSKAANVAARKGIAVIVSAGNSGQSPWFYIGAPADADSALAIAAVDPAGVLAGFSSRGPASDGDVKPNVAAQGASTVVCDPFNMGIQTGNGTSFASPVLCGLVACLIQAQPSFTNMQLLQAVEQSASQASNPDSLMGYGIPDFCAANLTLGGTMPATADALYSISPVPFGSELYFSFYSTVDQELQITLYDSRGRKLVDQQLFAVGNSENHYTLTELGAVATGVYILQVRSEDGTFTRKVVKGQ